MSLNVRENPESHRYEAVGSTLTRGVLDAVLDAGVATRVTCPFLVSWVEKHPEYAGRVVLG